MTNTGHKAWSTGQLHHRGGQKKDAGFSSSERRRLRQLMACLLLFAVVFVGRGAPEGRLHSLTQNVGEWVHRNTDFRAVFAQIGQAASEGGSFTETFGRIWTGVVGGEATPENDLPKEGIPPEGGDGQTLPAGDSTTQAEQTPVATPETPTPPAPTAQPEAAAPAAPTGLVEGATVTPVMGILTSSFGYRTHPIDKEWKAHDGIDIMADEGTPIRAFAQGVVDYIGQSPAYGNYLQLKHSNGVTTFYAHCSEILVKAGQTVAVGDTVAKVGATGNVTGAHLHLEMKKDGVRMDPAQYVQTLSQ